MWDGGAAEREDRKGKKGEEKKVVIKRNKTKSEVTWCNKF